jgi:hypothetical protein
VAPPLIQGVAHARSACLVGSAGSGPRTCRSPTVRLTPVAGATQSCRPNTPLAIVVAGPPLKCDVHGEPFHAVGRGRLARVTPTGDLTVRAIEHLAVRRGDERQVVRTMLLATMSYRSLKCRGGLSAADWSLLSRRRGPSASGTPWAITSRDRTAPLGPVKPRRERRPRRGYRA